MSNNLEQQADTKSTSENSHSSNPKNEQASRKELDQHKENTAYDPPSSLVLLTLVIFLFSQIVIAILLAIIMLVTGQGEEFFDRVTDSNINNFFLVGAITIIQFAGIFFVVRRLMNRSLSSIGLIKPVGIDFSRAVVGWGVYMVAMLTTLIIIGELDVGIDLQQEQQLDFQPPADTLNRILVFMSIVVAPAFIEEVLMRGFLFMNLRRRLNFVASTLIVSVLFGVAHLQFGSGEPLLWVAFVDTFVLSIVLCGLTEKYKTIWPAIFAHAIKNSLAFYLLFVREG